MGSWGMVILGGAFTAALLASYNMPYIGVLPGRRERPKLYWSFVAIWVAATTLGLFGLIVSVE